MAKVLALSFGVRRGFGAAARLPPPLRIVPERSGGGRTSALAARARTRSRAWTSTASMRRVVKSRSSVSRSGALVVIAASISESRGSEARFGQARVIDKFPSHAFESTGSASVRRRWVAENGQSGPGPACPRVRYSDGDTTRLRNSIVLLHHVLKPNDAPLAGSLLESSSSAPSRYTCTRDPAPTSCQWCQALSRA